jgi:NADH:ubiquinone oxidoreductase subunit 4 (subunit M)
LTGREWAAILPLIALMVWMGVASQTFLPPISAAHARILEETRHGVSIHVRNFAPASIEEAARAR